MSFNMKRTTTLSLLSLLALLIPTASHAEYGRDVPHAKRTLGHHKDVQPVMFLKFNPPLDHRSPRLVFNNSGIAIVDNLIVASGTNHWVQAKNFDNEIIWSIPAQSPLSLPPHVYGKNLYLAFHSGKLLKLNNTSGDKIWEKKLNSYASRKIIHAPGMLLVTSADGYLYALKESTGKTLWVQELGGKINMEGEAPPLVINKRIFISNNAGKILRLALETGHLQDKYELPQREGRFKNIVGQMYILQRNGRSELDDNTTHLTSSRKKQQLIVTAADGSVLSLSIVGGKQPQLGDIIWHKKLPWISTAKCINMSCYIALNKGEVFALNAENGETRWHQYLGWQVSSIYGHNSHLYLSGSKGQVAKLHNYLGKKNWQLNLGSGVLTPAVAHRGMLFFASGMGNVYVYRM